eukprot:TRINITY_DN3071_c0_g1_i1.p1 TRINITY_DN3071_c0_g1~~TRINITY_DN3071_c0_g1_i1.p1  ORF type:complete len:1452 (-),score=362.49 TRINITY_DN3071_c0_g1_i1:44-4399(-)
MIGEDALKVSSPFSREDQAFSASQFGNGPGSALLNEVLRQLDQERSERLAETMALKTDVRSQQVVLAQIAETVLGPTLQDGMESLQKDQERQQQAQDLQAAALREGLLDLAKQKENLAKLSAELQELRTSVCGNLATELAELREHTKQSGMLVAGLQTSLETGLRGSMQQSQESTEKCKALLEDRLRQVSQQCQVSVDECQTLLEAGLREAKQHCQESADKSLEEGLRSVSQRCQTSLEDGLREAKQHFQELVSRSQTSLEEGMSNMNQYGQASLDDVVRKVTEEMKLELQQTVDRSQAALEERLRNVSQEGQSSLEEGLRAMKQQCEEGLSSVSQKGQASLEEGLREVKQQCQESVERSQALLEEGMRKCNESSQESVERSQALLEEGMRKCNESSQESVERSQALLEEGMRKCNESSQESVERSQALLEEGMRKCNESSQASLEEGLRDVAQMCRESVDGLHESRQQLEQFRSTLSDHGERLTSLGHNFQQHQVDSEAVARHAEAAREAADAATSAESRLSAVYKEAQEQLALARSSVEADVATQSKTAAELEAIQAAAEVVKASAEAAAMEARSYANEAAKAASRCEQHSSGARTAEQVDQDQLLALRGELAAVPLQLREELRTWIEHCQETRRLVEAVALDSSSASLAHLEEMISLAMERTEQLEHNLLAMTSSSGGPQEGTESLKAQVTTLKDEVKSDMEDLRKQLRMELEQIASRDEQAQGIGTPLQDLRERMQALEAMQRGGAGLEGVAAARPTEASETKQAVVVRSKPAALHGLTEPARPLGPSSARRKALVIGCSYWESQCPLAGALNDSWNVLSLLRHSLQYGENQVLHLVDGSCNFKTVGPKRPTLAAITEGLHWLTSEAQPGDEVFLYFAGYGTLQPLTAGTFEAFLVPVDYAEQSAQSADSGGFKLLRMVEISRCLARLPAACKATIILDCCHASLPGVDGQKSSAIQWVQMQPGTFPGAEVSPHGFTPRARRLVLPPTGPVQQASAPDSSAPEVICAATCYLACHQAQWCAELPVEGVMQGAFTWSWVKAMVDGNLQGSAAQLRGSLAANLGSLQQKHHWFDQAPVMQSTRSAAALQESSAAVALPQMVPRPICSHQPQRKALLIGANYSDSLAPLKGAINDAWNMYSLLRHAFHFADDQIRLLLDGEQGGQRLQASDLPTRENILTQLQWLMEGAQPGDSLVLLFCGYGAQHPREPGSKEQEAYLVPSDFAADVPPEFLGMPDGSAATANRPFPAGSPSGSPSASFVASSGKAPTASARYRLISLLEVKHFMAQIPQGATLTTILDCAYPAVPGIGPSYNLPPTFQKVSRGRVDYRKLHDFVSRPRFLELPPLPVQHTPPQLYRTREFPQCRLHCFCACRLPEWDSELPLEGTVQGIFTWALAKALVAGGFQSSVAQLQEEVTRITIGLKEHFQGVGQTPVLMLSQSASLQDVVLQ